MKEIFIDSAERIMTQHAYDGESSFKTYLGDFVINFRSITDCGDLLNGSPLFVMTEDELLSLLLSNVLIGE